MAGLRGEAAGHRGGARVMRGETVIAQMELRLLAVCVVQCGSYCAVEVWCCLLMSALCVRGLSDPVYGVACACGLRC